MNNECVSCWVYLLLPPVLWIGVINHRRGLLFFWNCIHSRSIPATDCSLHLEFLPWGYMNRRKEAVNERAEEEKRFLPQKPFFIMVVTADHRWISWPQMKTLSVGFDPLWARREFASYLSQNHLAQGLDVIRFALSVQRVKDFSSKWLQSWAGSHFTEKIHSDLSVIPVYRYS